MRAVALAAVAALLATAVVATDAAASEPAPATPMAVAPDPSTGSPYAAVVESPAVPFVLRGVAGELTPLVGDFDGDGRADVFFYGPGARPDHLWLGRAAGEFRGVPITVRGTFHPVVGDFDGDRRSDILWYAAGDARDQVWFGGAGGSFAMRAVTVAGSFEPLPGDFDGDGRTDVLWYGPGGARDVLWRGGGDRRFRGSAVSVGGTYRPLVGDFDGDRAADVFWYGPGEAGDVVWYGAAGSFRARAADVRGHYEPVVGDFDGDRARDVLWFGPGADPDHLWYGAATRRFTGAAVTVSRTGFPLAADYDGDGRRDVLLYDAADGTAAFLYGRAAGGFDPVARTVRRGYLPVPGDFDGAGRGDVLWYAPGNAWDVVGSSAGRTFVHRATTIDVGFTRSPALRPELFRDRFRTYGYVAHAMGGYGGQSYTNSLDAFRDNYARGFRVFEADQVMLADGTVFVAHNGTEHRYGLSRTFGELTWREVSGARWDGRYASLRAEDLVALLRQHPDAYVILDFKKDAPRAFATYVRLAGGDAALMDRLIPHVTDPAMLAEMRRTYPLQNYVVALYRSQLHNRLDDDDLLRWVRRDRVPAVMMWHRQRDFTRSLAANSVDHRRYDADLIAGLRDAGAVTYVHTIDDPARVAWFDDRRIGIYTNFVKPPPRSSGPAPSPAPDAGQPSPAPEYGYEPFEGDEG